jgi:putative acetyltransferase
MATCVAPTHGPSNRFPPMRHGRHQGFSAKTVHAINVRDYTEDQVSAWAPETEQALQVIASKLISQRTVGIKECEILIGFGSLTRSFDIDMLYVHKHRQGQGVGTRLLKELENIAAQNGKHAIEADVSLTALPFFERRGYTRLAKQTVVRRGVALENCKMRKKISAKSQEPKASTTHAVSSNATRSRTMQ